MNNELYEVQCPHCFEYFEVSLVQAEVEGAAVDYDCEVCCCPMVIHIGDGVAQAMSLDDI